MKRVVITGLGAVTPLGDTFLDAWQAASEGRSGIRPLSRVPAADLPWKVAGEIIKFDPSAFLSDKERRRLGPFAQYAASSAIMAAEDAGLISSAVSSQPSSLSKGGVIFGSSRGGIGTIEKAISNQRSAVSDQLSAVSSRQTGDGSRMKNRVSPYLMPATTISMAASYTAMKLGINGYCLGISNACASGANAVGEAFRLIRSGFPGPVFAGGADAPICRICLEGYGTAKALSRGKDHTASRPFDRSRDGFVIAEGAAVLVLEEYSAALKRGAKIYAEVAGYGNSVDAFHQTLPSVHGEALAINGALSAAGTLPGEVDLISSHGTSTPAGDLIEYEAINSVFGNISGQIPVTAIKSMTGHMLAASGAFEAACTAMSVNQGTILPAINISEQDKRIRLKVVDELRRADIKTAVVNSFGFGGVNAVLVIKKVQ